MTFQSVIVSTYNKPRHLRLVLEGLFHQTIGDAEFEVIVADDGSGDETRAIVDEVRARASFRLEHVWQEDLGFRAARVRNLGVHASRGEQLIFLDGDCIPFPEFLEAHRARFREDAIEAGDRLFLDREPSDALTVEDVASGRFRSILPRSEYRSLRWRAFKDRVYTATRLKVRPKVVTANLAVPRAGFVEINGLDERFVGWGHEDEDLRRRFARRGYAVRSAATTALVCHLWHRQVDSFHGKVKHGDNVPYFKRGFYLSRCRMGLETRPLESCRISWVDHDAPKTEPNGDGPLEVAIAWRRETQLPEAEVRIAIGSPESSAHRTDADLIVECPTDGATDPPTLVQGEPGRPPRLPLPTPLDLDREPDRERLLEALAEIL